MRQLDCLLSDDSESRKAELYLESLEKIDDDCDVAGINFVKVDDAKAAAKEYGLEELPRLVLFKNKLPNVFEGETSVDLDLRWQIGTIQYTHKSFPNMAIALEIGNNNAVLRFLGIIWRELSLSLSLLCLAEIVS